MVSTAKGNSSFVTEVIRSTLIATIVTLLALLIFAVLMTLMPIDSTIIPTINQFIKAVAMVFGLLSGIRDGNRALLKGICAAILYVILSASLFYLLGGELNAIGMLIDLGIALAVGGVVGGVVAAKRN